MTETPTGWPASMTRDDLVARARDFVPVLRERARHAEELRRMPDQTVADFRAAGFYRILQPRRYGGYEMDYGAQLDMAVELGRGCASSAWDASNTACHSWIVGMFPAAAQDEVWGGDGEAMVSTAFICTDTRISKVDGGIMVSGRWKFSSGVDHCDWTLATLPLQPDSGTARVFALLPVAKCAIEDTWHAAGLGGTGSNDVVVEDVLVPDHRLLAVSELRGGSSPGSEVNDGYLYRLPLFAVFAYNVVGPGIGAARGAIESVVERLAERSSVVTRARLAELQSAQLRIAEASAEVDAAYSLIAQNCEELNRIVKAGEEMSMERRVRYRRDTAYAAMLSVRAVERVLPLVGGQGLVLDNAVQRAWRDVHAVAQHIGLAWDIYGSAFGAATMGLPVTDPNL